MLLLGLYDPTRNRSVCTQDEQRTFYEKGLLPSIFQLLGEQRTTDWPPTYDSEMFRARGSNGRLRFSTKVLPDWIIPHLADTIRENLTRNRVTWGEDLKILHQVRGVKNESMHSINSIDASRSLEAWLELNGFDHQDLIERSDCYVDVAAELSSDSGECLAWRTDAHKYMVQNILRIDEDNAVRITSLGSSKYTRDRTSHMTAVSGCRIATGSRAQGYFTIPYLQLYQTDKALTAHPDRGHHAKFLTCKEVLNGKYRVFMEELFTLCTTAANRKSSSRARVEVRCPLTNADEVLLDMDDRLLNKSLIAVPCHTWWYVSF